MKKLKIFFVSAALLLVTAGVFAGKSKYFVTETLFGYNSSVGYKQMQAGTFTTSAGDLLQVGTSGDTPATISLSTASYGVYYYNGASYVPVIF
jgi:hypothetical protein